jgi:EAL domain-containing protein (putative c-di-GMP-specific phosphodiesterase class I)
MRTFQTPTLTINKLVLKCAECGAEIFLGHSPANADRYYPIAVIKQQGADPDSSVRWVWNEAVYVDKKKRSWLYWLFGVQWFPCPHCGEKLSRLKRGKDLSAYPVVELPPASAWTPAAMGAELPREQLVHGTTLEDADEVKRDSTRASAEETGAMGAEELSEQAAHAKITPEEDALDDDSTYDRSYAVYDPKLDQHSPQRLTLVAELRHAIDADQLVLHYQPTVNLKMRQITSAEALVRWQHPQYDLLSPDDFIPMAERTGLIKPLTLWVLDHALRQQGAWKKEGLDIRVTVNMSAHGLLNLELPDLIPGLLTRHEVAPDRLVLEITGTNMIVNQQGALQILTRLTNIGVRLCQGDFGTGYSSLSYLSKFPVKEIKIDKSYVLDMIENDKHAMIVRATVDLAHNLGLEAIGEGTANEEIFAELEKLGCDAVQGAYISQPLSAEDFSRWIQVSPWPPKRTR